MYINSNEPFYGAVNSNHIVCIYTECSVRQLHIDDVIYKGYRVIAETVNGEVALGIYKSFEKAELVRKMLLNYILGNIESYKEFCKKLEITPKGFFNCFTMPQSDVFTKQETESIPF